MGRRPKLAAKAEALSFDDCVVEWMDDLGRMAFLLTGEAEAADDLVADALLAAWERWSAVQSADNPRAYVRRIVVNLAAGRVRRLVRHRSKVRLLSPTVDHTAHLPDIGARVDVLEALGSLPNRQRECIVLRYGMDMSEADVAEVLGVGVGTVKSQTSKGAAQLRGLLGRAVLQ